MSNRTKMYTTNAKARKWMIEHNFTDIHFFPHTRFSKDAYFGGLGWDGLATLEGKLALFQTKTNCKCTAKTKEQMTEVSKKSGVILLWINSIKREGLDVVLILN